MIRFPKVDRPDVTVVMVTYNRWDLSRQALQLLADVTEPRYEVVIVDNASVDGTADELNNVEGARILRNAHNLGFGPANNQGAAMARGRYLLLLNSDAWVRTGWFEPLIEIADGDAGVAAVAPKLLYPDGRLQEAGSILWRDARVRNYGDGDVPNRPEYLFRRTVDYASAACLLVRRSAFVDVGGFDPRFAPMYCEDVDLCLALAKRHGRVVYQPRSVVEHVRGASGSGGVKAARIERNRRLLRARWRRVLDRRPPESWRVEPAGIIGGRDAMTCERILVLTGPRPDAQGTPEQRRLADLVTAAAGRWPDARWTVASLDGEPVTRPDDLGDAGIEAVTAAESWDTWLAGRRYHYGIVAVADPRWTDGPLHAALEATQPQAARIQVGDSVDLGELASELGRSRSGIPVKVR
ncbi:MAG TPA: glycosyltransferase family 2 protein [Candidatus Dormibacteraeota bacterium]